MTPRFPDGFRWGAATAAYQIEGAAHEDGRGDSIWDTFSHAPGATQDGDTGDVACDHYHRYREDVALMAGLGLQDYRFSVAWPRVQPTGAGPANPAGLDFYSRLVDALLEHGVEPVVTLYHWDLPQPLQDAGGWTNRDTAARFADYAGLVAARLGDRVSRFSTLNEPWCSAFLGHGSGEHAPGRRDVAEALTAAYTLLLAHGTGLAALRAQLGPGSEVAITLNPANVRAASGSDADQEAVERAELLRNRMFLDPLLRGGLPPGLVESTKALTDWEFVRDGDLDLIGAPIDSLGINYYNPALVAATPAPDGRSVPWPGAEGVFEWAADGDRTGMGWPVEPASLTEVLVDLHREYPGVPFVITENGAAYPDPAPAGGLVDDPERCAYLRSHIAAIGAAIAAGVDVRGYYVWSLLDNFEWAWGYSQRFGIVHVDFDTLERTPKRSAQLYRQIIAAHGLPEDG